MSALRECPACALEAEPASVCPFCGYEFPVEKRGVRPVVWLLLGLMLLGAVPLLAWVLG